jgi:hypothetical protein
MEFIHVCFYQRVFITEETGVIRLRFQVKSMFKPNQNLLSACPLFFPLPSIFLLEVTAHSSLIFLAGQQDRRNDLSHPIHADNCLLDPEANECWKEPPAYTFRDYRYSQHLLQTQAFTQHLSKAHGNWKAALFCFHNANLCEAESLK